MDPTRYRIEPHHVPIWEREELFQDLMAAQLSRAPWFLMSLAVHGVAVLILLLMVTAPIRKSEVSVAVQPPTAQELVEPEPPPVEQTPEEVTEVEPQLKEVEIDPIDQTPMYDSQPDFAELPETVDWISLPSQLGTMPAGHPGRGGGGDLGGTPPRVTRSIGAGLEWLANHQDDDGRWDADEFMKHDTEGVRSDGAGSAVHDIGVTGLALLAFLADGNTLRSGSYRDVVRDGVGWLRAQQEDNGRFGASASHDYIYDHAIAAYAVCEAYGLSKSSILRRYAQAGINYLEAHRNPYGVWRYQPRDGDNDTSVTGWAVMAYKSAQDFGLQVNTAAFDNAAVWLDDVTDSQGKAGYTRRGELSSRHPGLHGSRFPPARGEALTAVGLLCRFFLGQTPAEHPVMTRAADTILQSPPVWNEDDGSIDAYYWYYASYGLYQLGGRHWKQWSAMLTDSVIKTQRQDGNFDGSWDPIGVWGEDGGRVYSTGMMVLTMQAYYRYTRLLR